MPMSSTRDDTILATSPLATLEARVQWAIKNRAVYTFEDTIRLNVSVPKIATDDDEEEIGEVQKKYERRYRLKKEEKFLEDERKKELEKRLEEERKMRMEMEMELEKLEKLKKLREWQSETTLKSSVSELPQLKRKRDIDNTQTTAPPMKVTKSTAKSTQKYGHRYNPPCERCEENDIACHKQIPVQTSCYACHQANSDCSFSKKNPRRAKSSSSDEEVLPVPTSLRRSARINGDSATVESLQTLNDKFSTLITSIDSMHTTIRDGFTNFQKTLIQLGEISHIPPDIVSTSSIKSTVIPVRDAPKESPVRSSINSKE